MYSTNVYGDYELRFERLGAAKARNRELYFRSPDTTQRFHLVATLLGLDWHIFSLLRAIFFYNNSKQDQYLNIGTFFLYLFFII